MGLDRSFMINLYWGGNILYENGFVKGDHSTLTTSNVVRHKLYEEFKDLVYAHIGVEKTTYKLNISLCYEFSGKSYISRIISDLSLDVMYYLAENNENYYAQVIIVVEKIAQEQVMPPTITSYVDLLRNFEVSEPNTSDVAFPLPNDVRFEAENDFGFDEANSQYSEDTSTELFSNFGEDSNDDVCQTQVMSFMDDVGDVGDDDIADLEDNIHIDVWKESENKIRLGMQFESKLQVKKAVTLWSINHNREFKVYESKSNLWVAKCKTLEDNYYELHTTLCMVYSCNIEEKSSNVEDYTFGGRSQLLWIISLNSLSVSSYILHSIEKDVAYPVKHIQSDIKNLLNVDVSYWKAWNGRRKAIETIYGTWESNFDELPKYIATLQASNPDTVVKWFNKPNDSSNVATFKYVFWAFGHAIDASRLCRPVISVDGCHLKGSYKGKLLVAVTKDANNNYYLLHMLLSMKSRHTVDRQLCVISDSHQGIIHAMENLQEWKEPLAYHRFCLRHNRSTRALVLKNYVGILGAPHRSKRKFVTNMREYLKQINKSQWCLLYDENRR
uniref:MULE transposase domain-containing protein n=1 Tax=Lactuca sativa TaxID=4236 RepID=A0A9R1XQU3_LACSA|nr:hypothetical protein LSAT_V11C300133080 [Lactuca sativa]